MAKIKIFKKGVKTKLSKNFTSKEFDCHCSYPECQWTHIDMDHVNALQKQRSKWKRSIHINSAYRCEQHNKDVGGTSNSRHKVGDSTDISVTGMTPDEVANDCEASFTGLGRYNTFTHVDSRPSTSGKKFRWDFRKK